MTDKEFDIKLIHIEEQYQAGKVENEGRRDQDLAHLFQESGWTQERIAKRVGKSQQWVDKQLRFARFLAYYTCSNSQLASEKLTEGSFRRCWGRSRGKSEEERFKQVARLLSGDVPPGYKNLINKPGIRKAIIEKCADGVKRSVAEIAAVLADDLPTVTRLQVSTAMAKLQKKPPKGIAVEAQHLGRVHRYRLVSKEISTAQSVDPQEAGAVVAEVLPIFKEIQKELKKSVVTLSTAFLMERVHRIEQALLSLLQPVPVNGRH
jgi:hypothetical protein